VYLSYSQIPADQRQLSKDLNSLISTFQNPSQREPFQAFLKRRRQKTCNLQASPEFKTLEKQISQSEFMSYVPAKEGNTSGEVKLRVADRYEIEVLRVIEGVLGKSEVS
jgi:hypothetical protein